MTAIERPTSRIGTRVTRHWPWVAGLAFGAMVGLGSASGADVAAVVAASGFVYIGAAAVRGPFAAWPMFGLSVVIIGMDRFVPGVDPVWALAGVAAVLAAVGAVRGGLRPGHGLPLQSAAMLVLGAVALVAAQAQPVAAGLLVAGALLGHAAWDVHHHRTGRVVTRSLAEFCMALDVLVAVLVLVGTFA